MSVRKGRALWQARVQKNVQRYLCKSCNKIFSGIDWFVGRHFDADIIIRALSMVATKMSPDEAHRQLNLEDIKIDASIGGLTVIRI